MTINDKKINILISGCTCSGKTTLANKINEIFDEKGCVIHQDDYFKDIEDIPRCKLGLLFDSVNAFHIREYINDMNTLLEEGKVLIPNYDIKTNTRLDKNRVIYKKNINVFEGLHTIDALKSLKDTISIFIDTDLETCIERRIKRDIKYGIEEEQVREYFFSCIFPMYKAYIEKQKYEADYIIERNSDEVCLLKKLMHY